MAAKTSMARTSTRAHLLGYDVPLWVKVLHEMDNYRVEIEAPEEVMEAFGIFDSAEELGVEPDDEGLPPEAYERGRWN